MKYVMRRNFSARSTVGYLNHKVRIKSGTRKNCWGLLGSTL